MNLVVCRWDPFILRALLDRQASIVLLFDEWEATHRVFDPELLARVDRVVCIQSFDAIDQLAQLVVQLQLEDWRVDKVLSLSEFSQFGAAYLAHLLGLAQPAIELSILTRDKRAMKQQVATVGIPCARFVSISTADVPGGIAQVEKELGFPVVVKPAAGMGTVDTRFVRSADELRDYVRPAGDGTAEQYVMAEEVVHGEEFHVDAIWRGGRALVLTVSQYLKPRIQIDTPGADNGSFILARAQHAELYQAVEAMHARINDSFGIGDEITHLEVFQTADGQVLFSEIASRFAGGAIPQMFRQFGMDLRELWLEAVLGTEREELLGLLHEPPYPYVGWVNIAPTEPGVIVQEPTEEELARFAYVLDVDRTRQVGEILEELHPSIWCLLVVFGGSSEGEIRERALALQAGLTPSYRTESPAT
jgi:hypothetical protein